MRGAGVIAWRDFRSALDSPATHVLVAVFLALSGFRFLDRLAMFSTMSDALRQRAVDDPSVLGWLSLDEAVVMPYMQDMVLLLCILVPLLTMRLLAEEKRSGTIELLLTAPVSPAALVGGKFFGGVMLALVPIALSTWQPLTLLVIASPDPRILAGGLLGVLVLAAAFTSVGLLASALTESPLLAAFLSFATLLGFALLGAAGSTLQGATGKLMVALSPIWRFGSIARGMLDTGDLVYIACFTLGMLFLTHRVIESRRWR